MKNKIFYALIIVSFGMIFIFNLLINSNIQLLDLFMAWLLAVVGAVSGLLVHVLFSQSTANQLFPTLFICHPIRIFLIIFLLFYLERTFCLDRVSFFFSFFIAYFVFMFYDVGRIYKLN